MKTLFASCSCLTCGILLWLPFVSLPPPSLPWSEDYPAALEAAGKQDQLLLLYLHTEWCMYCRQMESETFTDPSVVGNLASRYVWVRLDAERSPMGSLLHRRFQVRSYPTVLILRPDETELGRLLGFVSPDRLAPLLEDRIAAGIRWLQLQQQAGSDPDSVEL